MCGSMVDSQSATADIRRGIKKNRKKKKKPQGKNIMSAFATHGGHNNFPNCSVGDRRVLSGWETDRYKLECGPMPNVMVALPNIGGAVCSTPQFG